MSMLRGLWVVRKEDGYVSLSRRFPLAERKHRKQSPAAPQPIPDDVELGSDLVNVAKAAKEHTENSPLYEHVLESSSGLWPMVVLESAGHLVAFLPLVPREALVLHEKAKAEARERGHGLWYYDAIAQALQPVPSVLLAMEAAAALAGVLSDHGKREGEETWEETYQRAWRFVLDGIPAGSILDTSVENVEGMLNAQYAQKPRRRWF